MNSKLINVLVFVAGAAIGSAVTWKLIKTKYERIANEEIESVRDVYRKKRASAIKEEVSEGLKNGTMSISDARKAYAYANKIIDDEDYISDEEKEDDLMIDKPRVISPEEFGEEPDYATVTLYYYNDGILANTFDEAIDDIDAVVGEESLKHFGEYEDDSVFVRDDLIQTDYEILLDSRNFSDVIEGIERDDE